MGIENKVNTFLNKAPAVKKLVKRSYQLAMYAVSPKIKYEGNIKRVTPKDGKEYFFGYYDKSPWDITDRYMLCLRVGDTTKSTAPKEKAEIILIDTKNDNSYKKIAETNTWNVQQGSMLQWLGPNYDRKIIYNDFRNNRYCSVILDIYSNEEKVIDMPVYSVANDGSFALSLDFSRLHRLRKGYGYSNKEEKSKGEKVPDKTCIWKVDLETGKTESLLNYTDFYNFETREDMVGAEHKVNHIMLNPSANRFMVLHRWVLGSKKFTRLITINTDGNEMYNLSDDDMTSHCYWKNDNEIIAYARKKEYGNGYFLMQDRSDDFEHKWPELAADGHPSYSPDGNKVVTDTYPNRSRLSKVYIIENNNIKTIAKVFAPFKYDNDFRCDLHPRWNRDGDKICIDAVFEGKRKLYIIGK
ncbi:hypothetical protein [Oceanobacillus sp. FSL W7-1293]|uniref:hypothetical protein n=1 Tax=Oceanobacillus sp. FSL W7-1293 TaxID=2921699 RepID=UPI0030CD1A73